MARRNDRFELTMHVTTYELSRDGLSDEQIAKTMGVSGGTFRAWCKKKPALKDALDRGRKRRDPGEQFTFHQYVFDHLSPHLREVWEEINLCEKLPGGVEMVETFLEGSGIRARQHLFVYALTQSMFNVSQSMKKLGITRKTYDYWCNSDTDFMELIEEIHWHKKNYFESAFIERVAAGDTAAIMHAVKTQCRDRGYNDKIEIEHTGTVQHAHSVNVVDLELPIDTRRAILTALRAHSAPNAPTLPQPPLQLANA